MVWRKPGEPESFRSNPGDERQERKYCLNCVTKHLSAAYAINSEIVNGYPENTEFAVKEVRAAADQGNQAAKVLLMPALGHYAAFKKSADPIHIQKAHALIQKALEALDPGVPLSRYMTIGHLVQAEEEAWQEDPELSARIRAERLKTMDTKTYVPDLSLLLAELDIR